MPLDKRFFIDQLADKLRESAGIAMRAEADAREAAATLATEDEKRADGRAALEFGSLATGQAARVRKAQEELETLARFAEKPVPVFTRTTPIGLGAMVDVRIEGESRGEERTFIILPVGAGTELSGPDGDGFLSVITPQSPVGRALLGKCVGATIDVTVKNDVREWTVVDIS